MELGGELTLINEIKQNGHVVETCRKYVLDPSMFYRWKEIYDTYGVDGLISGERQLDTGIFLLAGRKQTCSSSSLPQGMKRDPRSTQATNRSQNRVKFWEIR